MTYMKDKHGRRLDGSQVQSVVHVIVAVGQSNMAGRGYAIDPIRHDLADPHITQWPRTGVFANQFVTAAEPLGYPDAAAGMGPALVFARHLRRGLLSTDSVAIVPAAYGGTGFASDAGSGFRWDVNYTAAQNLAALAVTQANAAIAAITAGGSTAVVDAILWLQGETDGDGNLAGTAYQTYLTALIAYLRTNITGATNTPFIIGGMVPEYLTTGTRTAIDAVHKTLPTTLPNVGFAAGAPGRNNGDGNHYNASAQRINGRRMFLAHKAVLDATTTAGAPATVTNVVLTAPAAPTVAVPATPSGLAASAITTSSFLLSWTAVSGAVGYVVQESLDSGSTWHDIVQTTGTSVTRAGRPPLSVGSYRLFAVNASGSSEYSSTVNVTTLVSKTALGVTGHTVGRAYSVARRVVADWSGSLIRVRRSTDNTSMDIGLSGTTLDSATLLTFCGSGDGFITTWYDQSGNGHHIGQATTTKQPKIVAAGALVTANSLAAVLFDGTDDSLFSLDPDGYTAGATTALIVTKGGTQTAGARLVAETDTTVTSRQYSTVLAAAANGINVNGQIGSDSGVALTDAGTTGNTAAFNSVLNQLAAVDTGAAMSWYVNAAMTGRGAVAYTRPASLPLTRWTMGSLARTTESLYFNGYVSELVIFNEALGSTDQGTAQASQKAFFATP